MTKNPLGQLLSSVKESNQRAEANALQRKLAGESSKSIILSRSDLDGNYDA